MKTKQTKCTGRLKVHETPDGRDIWVCNKCGKQGKFDFDLSCQNTTT